MFNFKKSLIAIIGLAVLAGLIALVTPTRTQGQGGGNQQPLNVNVVNTPSTPALVRDVGIPLRTALQIEVDTLIPFGDFFGNQDVYTVPAGKRLVIEHAALESKDLIFGQTIRGTLMTQFGGEGFDHPLALNLQVGPGLKTGPLLVANHPLLAFADEGTTVKVRVTANVSQGSGFGAFKALEGTLSGYLESVP